MCTKRADKQSEDVKLHMYFLPQVTCMQLMCYIIEIVEITSCLQLLLAVAYKSHKKNQVSKNQKVFDFVVHTMESDQSRVWTSMEVYEFYL